MSWVRKQRKTSYNVFPLIPKWLLVKLADPFIVLVKVTVGIYVLGRWLDPMDPMTRSLGSDVPVSLPADHICLVA